MSLQEIYDNNELFKHYVDKYAQTHKLTTEEALKHKILKQYAEYLGENVDED